MLALGVVFNACVRSCGGGGLWSGCGEVYEVPDVNLEGLCLAVDVVFGFLVFYDSVLYYKKIMSLGPD